jgi:predicted nucleic acid-binding protein
MIVFDSSTLLLLAKAGLLDDFISDYSGEIIIPMEVKKESCDRKDSFDSLLIQERIDEKKIKALKVHNTKLCEKFMQDFSIAKGEAEALVLAFEEKAALLAVDDKNAIKASKILKIPFTTAISILVRLAERGIIDINKAKEGLGLLAAYGRYKDTTIREAMERLKITKEG